MSEIYTYRFNGETIDVPVSEELFDILNDFDRLESNSNRKERRHNYHYDNFAHDSSLAFGYEEQYSFTALEGSKEFEKAISQLSSDEVDILISRDANKMTFKEIAKAHGKCESTISVRYYKIREKFIKYYTDEKWLNSVKNIDLPNIGKIKILTKNLTPNQIQWIRQLRYKGLTQSAIVKRTRISLWNVQHCLVDNPVDYIPCAVCGNPSKAHGSITFCSDRCSGIYHKTKYRSDPYQKKYWKWKLSIHQKRVIHFYRFHYLGPQAIHELTGIKRYTIEDFLHRYPLEYSVCRYCGTKMTGDRARKVRKYCSNDCYKKYYNDLARRKRNNETTPDSELPSVDSLYQASELRSQGYRKKRIREITKLSREDVNLLFAFDIDYTQKSES